MAKPSKRNRELRRLGEALQPFQLAAHIQQHSGPLPDPETLAGYEQALPGLADRIVRMAEGEAAHRRDLEKKLLSAQIDDAHQQRRIEKVGQFCALIIACVTVVAGVIVICAGHPGYGTILSGGTIVSLAGLFIYGRERKIGDTASPPEDQVNAAPTRE